MKKKLSFIIAIVMLLQAVFIGCASSGNNLPAENPDSSAGTENPNESTESTETASPYDSLTPQNYDGYTFRFFTEGSNYGITMMDAEDITAEVVNDAIYVRNRYIEKELNLVFSDTWADWTEPRDRIKIMVTADTDEFDVMLMGVYLMASLKKEHMLNLYDLSGINWNDPWWEKEIRDVYEIKGKLYFSHSPMNLHYYESLVPILFNKQIALERNIEDLYAVVREGKWTYDKMASIASGVIDDRNGDGVYKSTDDLFGIAASTNLVAFMVPGGDCQIIVPDETGYPSFPGLTEKLTGIVSELAKTFSTPNMLIENGEYIREFQNQHSFFFLDTLGRVKDFRALDEDFGILPVPKYDEDQEKYISSIFNGALCFVVPSTCELGENTGTVLNYLSALSHRDLIPAYYEKNIQGQQMRDEDSVEMLNIMLSNIRADLSLIFEWCGMNGTILSAAKNNGEGLASKFKAMEKAMGMTIDRMYSGYSD